MTTESHDYETIADHYQQASLHLEAAAEHLNQIANETHSPAYSRALGETASEYLRAAEFYEQRAQAALKETNGYP